MSVAFTAGTASSSAEVKSSSVMPYFSFSSFITASFTRPDSSASPMGSLPSSRFSVSAGMASARVFLFCSAPRWGSRSVITSRGSSASAPMFTCTVVPSRRATTPWSSMGMVTHWYLRMPP